MKADGTQASGRRISFLMPYIDFCFMLIIIFVSMISIAYFEPLGLSDFQTKKEKPLEQTEGRFEVRPGGINIPNAGVGMKRSTGELRPMAAGAERIQVRPQKRPPVVGKAPVVTPKAGTGDASKEELDKLKKQLEEERKRLRELEAREIPKKTIGDHFYIDLRK